MRPDRVFESREDVFEDAVLHDGGAPKSKRFLSPSSVMVNVAEFTATGVDRHGMFDSAGGQQPDRIRGGIH